MATYLVHGPQVQVPGHDLPSQKTANADLSSTDWAASTDTLKPPNIWCPRTFVANFSGTLSFKAMGDSSNVSMVVVAGYSYDVSLASINRAGCSAPLQVANAVTLLY